MTTFYRLLKDTDKAAALRTAVAAHRSGETDPERTFAVDPAAFSKVPNTPFAYWADDEIRDLFVKLPPFESEGRTVKQGLATADDFRFVRAWWEVDPARRLDPGLGCAPDWREDLEGFQAWCRRRTHEGKGWAPFAKGGEYSPYYSDIHLVVNWEREGEEIKNFVDPKTGKQNSRPQNTDYYFRPGVTWPARTTSGWAVQVLPTGGIFGHRGYSLMGATPDETVAWCIGLNTRLYQGLLEILLGFGDEAVSGSAARDYTVGVVQQLPVFPGFRGTRNELIEKLFPVWDFRRLREANDPTHLVAPMEIAISPLERAAIDVPSVLEFTNSIGGFETTIREVSGLIDEAISKVVRFLGENLCIDTPTQDTGPENPNEGITRALLQSSEDLVSHLIATGGNTRASVKKMFFLDRRIELIAQTSGVSLQELLRSQPDSVMKIVRTGFSAPVRFEALCAVTFGSTDLRLSLNPDLVPALPDPFDPLPVVPPATLVGPDGLPATSGHIVSEEWLQARPNAITLPTAGSVTTPIITDDEYPIPIPWDGILVDDPDHPSDIVARIRQVLTILHGERAQQAEEELCGELAVDTLREYIANPKGFFADHLSRYSKSRRKAPIYWPLSTPSGGWTAWIYYPRLTDATIYTLIERYLHPRLELARQLYEEVSRIPAASRSPGQQRQFDLSSRDKDELATMEEELKGIAAMPYRVNHDDGVPILAAPFAGMFRHREWAKYVSGIWEKLDAGEYDWAHLAYAIWPERVREKARDDRSIAIAHGIKEAQ